MCRRFHSAIRVSILATVMTAAVAHAQITVHRHLRVEDGLVQSQVNAILEDSRGFVWFGTFGGVSRWDGQAFRNFQTQDGLGSLDVRVIDEAPDGALIFGTSESGISVYRDGAFTSIDERHGLPGPSVRDILRTPDGRLHVATSKGIVTYADASFDSATATYALRGKSVSGLERRRAGGIYACTFGDGVFVLEGDTTAPLDPHGRLPGTIIRAIHEDDGGTLWISVYKSGLWRLREGVFTPFSENGRFSGSDVKAITPARDGTLYFSTLGDGVGRYHDGRLEMIGIGNGLANVISWNAHEGRSGVVYLGTWSGVDLYQPDRMLTINEATGLPEDVATAAAELPGGRMYIGTIGGGVAEFDGSVLRVYDTSNGLVHNTVWSLCASRDGTLYVGTHAGLNAIRDGKVETLFQEPRELHGRVYQVHEGGDGTLYLGTYGGAFRYSGGVLHPYHQVPEGERPPAIYAITEASDGTIYFGTARGVFTVRNDEVSFPEYPSPLDEIRVWSIFEAHDGTMCFGTNGAGLCMARRDEDGAIELEILDVPHGLTDNTVYGILQDAADRLYLSTHRGVNIVDLSGNGIQVRHLNHYDGLGSDECNQGGAFQDSLGRMWFGNNGGMSVFDPRNDPPDRTPPQVQVTRVRLFDDEVPLSAFADGAAPFAHDQNYFRFAYVGTYPLAPEKVIYRYRLSGIDRDWVEAKERQVQYTALPHAAYTFQVSARNDWGVWSEPAVLAFEVAPPFWETWWFVSLAVLAVGGAVALIVMNRVRHLLALERLRTRIAADLHDDIGAGLTEIAITSEVIAHKLPDESQAAVADELTRIGTASRHLVDSMSDIVWLVNPRRDSLHDLIARLGDVYKEAISAQGISFRVQNVESLKSVRLRMEHRQHVFLIFKEAINNAVKYSGCTEMTLSVGRERGRFALRFADNGSGFDTGLARSGNGLENMRERARAIRATLLVDSTPGQGTSVLLTF